MYYPVSQQLIGRELVAPREKSSGQIQKPTRFAPEQRAVVWAAMLIGSMLPSVIAQYFGYERGFLLPILQSASLVILAVIADHSPRLRAVLGFLLAIAVLRLTWSVIAPALASTNVVGEISKSLSVGGRLFLSRLLFAMGMPLMLLTMAGLRVSRRTLYLHRGDMSAAAQPIPLLLFRQPQSWMRLGPILLGLFGIALPLYLYFSLRPALDDPFRLFALLPWALGTAALNAASEEFQFRCIPLAQLRGVLPVSEVLWLTSIFFGIGHYFGQPSGPSGAIMATIAGWFWAKSIVETRGVAWAFIMHMVQDVVIFYFLVLATAN